MHTGSLVAYPAGVALAEGLLAPLGVRRRGIARGWRAATFVRAASGTRGWGYDAWPGSWRNILHSALVRDDPELNG
jgi:hypothetical protein